MTHTESTGNMQMNLKHNSRLTVHSKEAEVRVNTGILQMVNTSLADSDMDSEEVMRADSLTSLKNCSDITAPEADAHHGGKGANGGPDGDLYITFVIGDDPNFRRKGDDLFTDVTIDLYTAVLGGEVTVNTLDGQVKLKVRPGTQNDAMVRLKGKGFPVYKQEGSFGDLIVTYHITIPTNLTEKQKELFRQIQQG